MTTPSSKSSPKIAASSPTWTYQHRKYWARTRSRSSTACSSSSRASAPTIPAWVCRSSLASRFAGQISLSAWKVSATHSTLEILSRPLTTRTIRAIRRTATLQRQDLTWPPWAPPLQQSQQQQRSLKRILSIKVRTPRPPFENQLARWIHTELYL